MAGASGRVNPEGIPSEEAIEQDFSTPEDADYSPGPDDGAAAE